MKTLETDRLVIRPFVFDDADEYRRLLDEAFGHESYGAEDTTRLLLEYHVIADKAHDALHQTPYEDRAIVRRSDGTLIGAVGFAACLAPFGQLRSFDGAPHRTSEVGLFWALFREHFIWNPPAASLRRSELPDRKRGNRADSERPGRQP